MPLLTRSRVAMLFAVPAILVPGIQIPLMIWARHAFIARHPDYLDNPPTISRAISDPVVGGPFADLILVITALTILVVPLIVWAYLLAILRLPLSRCARLFMVGLLAIILACQFAASSGMILTTQYTLSNNTDMHMLGSYLFFAFQALTILLAATLCRMLLHQQQKLSVLEQSWPFRPGMRRFRFHFALVIICLTVIYGVLFVIKDWTLPISVYAIRIAYTQCEVLVISSFVLFLGSYAVDIRDMVQRDILRPSLSWTPVAAKD